MTPAPPVTPPYTLRYFQSGNFWPGRPYGAPIALVIHTEAGTEAGTESEFQQNASQVSAHFGVALDGSADWFVSTANRAWANGILEPGNNWASAYTGSTGPSAETGRIENPNNWTVSIETEDRGSGATPVSDAQYATVLALGRQIVQEFPSIRYLLRHADISPASRVNCPGPRWVQSGRFQALADALGLTTLL